MEIGRLRLDELPEGAHVKLDYPPYDILVANVAGELLAIEDACPHSGHSLARGSLEGATVLCPGHQWSVDLRDGKVLTAAGVGLSNPVYEVTVEGEWVVVRRAESA